MRGSYGRSNTWPVVVVNLGKNGSTSTTTTQLDANFNERTRQGSTGQVSSCTGTVLDARKAATLTRHYYPEGGWGFVILACSTLVYMLNHGLQLSFGVLIFSIHRKFRHDQFDSDERIRQSPRGWWVLNFQFTMKRIKYEKGKEKNDLILPTTQKTEKEIKEKSRDEIHSTLDVSVYTLLRT